MSPYSRINDRRVALVSRNPPIVTSSEAFHEHVNLLVPRGINIGDLKQLVTQTEL
ncbi:hypothetical protein EYZ11_005601 [Aspergillus tanneri]|uniref:Uncharacterized protein n=1 Tax=Aspergillus tanneri TaxID=1220188 RepID=A0A4S3JK15_9EURO|nr:hypothetical protein EYZ11_005601 [Aspergillus tanneri]